jgi:Uma2 family endonuclease
VHDVLLAVEVMSPTSVRTDRLAKPAQYAQAGIPSFWRLELDPLVLVVHALDGDVYRETGRFTEDVVVEEPVRLRFRVPGLID